MQLNTPTDQRQIHNYQRLFIKFTSSLCLYFFSLLLLLVVVFGYCYCFFFLLVFVVFSFHLESKKGLHVLSLFSLEQVILILNNFMISVYFR